MARQIEQPPLPRSVAAMRAWLRDTDAGREILTDATRDFLESECRKCQRPRVLIVVRRLGPLPGVEVFHEKGVTVRLEELVDSQDDPAMEVLVEKLLEAQLPRLWKPLLHQPGYRRDSMVFTGLTAERRIQSVLDLELIRELSK